MPAEQPDPPRMDPEALAGLRTLLGAARAHLESEAELGGVGVPRVNVSPVTGGQPADASLDRTAPPEVRRRAAAPASVPASVNPGPPMPSQATERTARLPLVEVTQRLSVLAEEAATCKACVLHEQRTHNVFARGSAEAELVFVGEGPGAEEDRTGQPFVGPAGQLLDRMVAAMGYGRDEVYICNIVKCRPPGNRTPRPEEALACSRFLKPQLELVAPRMIVALGRCAAEHLGVAKAEGAWRGRWGRYGEVPVMPTYHPAYLLRSPEHKGTVWKDLQQVMAKLGRTPPPRTRGE